MNKIFLSSIAFTILIAQKETNRIIKANNNGFTKIEKPEYNPSEVVTIMYGR